MKPTFDAEYLKQRYNPDGSKLREYQLELLEMLDILADICERNNIKWWLSSGTLLGAARHQGFIPWDDDVDIVMLRKDYKRLEKILLKMESEEFVFQSMRSDIEYLNPFGKFRRRLGDVQIAGANHRHLKHKGQFIDIFSIEKTSYLAARSAYIVFINLRHLTTYVEHRRLRRIMIRLIECICFGVVNPILRLIGLINPRGEYHYTMGTGWAEHTFFMKDTQPLTTIEFEGRKYPAPKDTDAYLTKVYGKWRELPTEEVIRRSLHSTIYAKEIYEN